MDNKWICHERESKYSDVSLFCLPCSGGTGASYANWKDCISDRIDIYPIQYPMREKRLREPMPDTVLALARQIGDGCIDLLSEKEFAFWGHCGGALIGYELSLYLTEKYQIAPVAFYVASSPAPSISLPLRYQGKLVSDLDLEEFEGFLRKNMTFDEEFYSNKAVLQYYKKITVKDFKLIEEYTYDKTSSLGHNAAYVFVEEPFAC